VTSRQSTSMIGLMFLAHLSSELLHQDCSIRPQSSSSITMSILPCGYYNKATLFWCRSFAAFTYHDLLRLRCYSNEVTPVRIITTSSMAYSVVDASEHLLIIIHDENLLYHCCFRLRDEYFRQRHGVFISRVDVSSSSSLRRDLSQKQHVAEIVMGILKR